VKYLESVVELLEKDNLFTSSMSSASSSCNTSLSFNNESLSSIRSFTSVCNLVTSLFIDSLSEIRGNRKSFYITLDNLFYVKYVTVVYI